MALWKSVVGGLRQFVSFQISRNVPLYGAWRSWQRMIQPRLDPEMRPTYAFFEKHYSQIHRRVEAMRAVARLDPAEYVPAENYVQERLKTGYRFHYATRVNYFDFADLKPKDYVVTVASDVQLTKEQAQEEAQKVFARGFYVTEYEILESRLEVPYHNIGAPW